MYLSASLEPYSIAGRGENLSSLEESVGDECIGESGLRLDTQLT